MRKLAATEADPRRLKRQILLAVSGGLLLLGAGIAVIAFELAAVGGAVFLGGVVALVWAFRAVFRMERLRLHHSWTALAGDTGLKLVTLPPSGMPGFDRRLEGTVNGQSVSVYLIRARRGAVLECAMTRERGQKPATLEPQIGLWPFTPAAQARRAELVMRALDQLTSGG